MHAKLYTLIGTLLVAGTNGLGINCRGSSSCAGSSGTLTALTAEVCNHGNQGETKAPGDHFAQAGCGDFSGAKAVFVQNTDQHLSYGQVCGLLRQLEDHGCKGCGSIPINPGNDVGTGEVTVNYVASCTCTGNSDTCGGSKIKKRAALAAAKPEPIPQPEAVSDVQEDNVLVKRLGINCRGSSSCGVLRFNNQGVINDICNADPSQTWGPGEHIASYCQDFNTGLAAFTQNTGDRITQPRACELAKQLQQHGCNKCGSVPYSDNDVSKGELTFNYVSSC